MRIFAATALVLLSGMSAHAANVSGSAVILRALDKVTATTQDYTVEIGDILQYGSLSIETSARRIARDVRILEDQRCEVRWQRRSCRRRDCILRLDVRVSPCAFGIGSRRL